MGNLLIDIGYWFAPIDYRLLSMILAHYLLTSSDFSSVSFVKRTHRDLLKNCSIFGQTTYSSGLGL